MGGAGTKAGVGGGGWHAQASNLKRLPDFELAGLLARQLPHNTINFSPPAIPSSPLDRPSAVHQQLLPGAGGDPQRGGGAPAQA